MDIAPFVAQQPAKLEFTEGVLRYAFGWLCSEKLLADNVI